MTEGRLETESRSQECLAIVKREVTSNALSKRRVRTRTHGVVGGTAVSHRLLPDLSCSWSNRGYSITNQIEHKKHSNCHINNTEKYHYSGIFNKQHIS